MPVLTAVRIYKTYYTSLWKCLPKDANKNLDKLHIMKVGIADTTLNRWRKFPSSELINEVIVGAIMSTTKSNFDTLMFCGVMEKLMDNMEAKMFINYVREGMYLIQVIYTICFIVLYNIMYNIVCLNSSRNCTVSCHVAQEISTPSHGYADRKKRKIRFSHICSSVIP